MTDPKDISPPARSKVAEQALQVLRDTRAKMDPDLLSRMKALLSPLAKMAPPAPTAHPEGTGLEKKDGLFAAPEKPITRSSTPSQAASLYGSVQNQSPQADQPNAKSDGVEMIPVDRQKIAKIVLKYMELREEKKPGN